VSVPEWQPVEGLKIAIDGPSGSGKGTVAARIAGQLGLPVLDSGLLYRFVACLALESNIPLDDAEAIVAMLDEVEADMDWQPSGLRFRDEDWTARLRSEKAGSLASKVAALMPVREKLLQVQRRLAASGCVMDGRDIGTVVLPEAQAKFYLTASVQARSRRRWLQLQGTGAEDSFAAVIADMKARDRRDMERTHAPLKQAQDAIHIDTTTMRVDEVVDRMLAILERRGLIQRTQRQCMNLTDEGET